MQQKVIVFPEENIGYLNLVDTFGSTSNRDEYRISVGNAQGTVTVPESEAPYMLQLTLIKDDLSPLSKLRSDDLQSVVFMGNSRWSSKITDSSIESIRHLSQLRELILFGTRLTDAAVNAILALRNLESLSLCKNFISDASINEFARLPKLKTLSVGDTLITTGGAERLRQLLPNCIVHHYEDDHPWAIEQRKRIPKIQHVERLLEHRPNDLEIILQLADLFMQDGEYGLGLGLFDRAVALAPKDGNVIRRRGTARRDAMQFESAIEDFSRALELNPRDSSAYVQRGAMRIDLFQTKEGKADIEQALSIDSANADVHVELANMYVYQGKVKKAITELNKAVKKNPKHTRAYFDRAICYEEDDDLKAIADYTHVVDLEPDHYEARGRRANLYAKTNQLARAIEDWQWCIAYSEKLHDGKVGWYEDQIAEARKKLPETNQPQR